MEGCGMREKERKGREQECTEGNQGLTHQIQQKPYRISCKEILYVIVNRFSGNRILCPVLQKAAANHILWQIREIKKDADKVSDSFKGM